MAIQPTPSSEMAKTAASGARLMDTAQRWVQDGERLETALVGEIAAKEQYNRLLRAKIVSLEEQLKVLKIVNDAELAVLRSALQQLLYRVALADCTTSAAQSRYEEACRQTGRLQEALLTHMHVEKPGN
jgi:hypothetical protein